MKSKKVTNESKQRLAQTLRMQNNHINTLLESKSRDESNFHIVLAGDLRSMLCDKDYPTLLTLAEELFVDLCVWGPFSPAAINLHPPDFLFNALIASAEPVYGGHRMSAIEYLDAPIGAISFVSDNIQKQEWYTPRDLIKWAANKEGPSHFNLKPVAKFESIGNSLIFGGEVSMKGPASTTDISKNDALPIRMALLQIAIWAAYASELVLKSYENNL